MLTLESHGIAVRGQAGSEEVRQEETRGRGRLTAGELMLSELYHPRGYENKF